MTTEEKQNIDIFFMPLPYEDIEEKVKINQDERGYTLIEFKEQLEHELHIIQRSILEKVCMGQQSAVATLIQEQNLREQISYVNNKIIKELLWQSTQRQ